MNGNTKNIYNLKRDNLSFKNFYFPIIYFFSSIILEIGTFVALGFGILPTYFVFDLSIILIVCGIVLLIPNKVVQMVLIILALIVQAVLSYVNITLYNIYGDLFSFDMIALGNEAFKSFDPSFFNYGFIAFLLVLFGTSITLMSVSLKNKITEKINLENVTALLLCFLVFQTFGLSSYSMQVNALSNNTGTAYDSYFNNDEHLYDSLFIKSEGLKKFGTGGFYARNINKMFNKKDDTNKIDATKEYIKNGTMNVANAHTGILENDNLIVVMCESLEWYGIDEVLTPTLYELYYNGTHFNNYISKSKTNYSEMDCILGSVPSNNSFTNGFHGTTSNLLGNTLSFTMPNKFKKEGYESVKFFHDNDGDFYGRSQTHPTFGFDEVVTLDKMDYSSLGGIDRSVRYQRDSDMVKLCIDKIVPVDKKFCSFITTVTTHGPYKENHLLQNYYNQLTDEVYNEYLNRIEADTRFVAPKDNYTKKLIRNYIASCMDLDYAMELLIKHLTDNNLMENTTIVLYADHNAYFHELSYIMRGIDKNMYYQPLLYRIPATIYSKKIGEGVVEDFTNPYNLLPTIFDLFGISYNTNLYMAPSIYSEDFKNNIFISQIGGIMTKDLYSDNVNDIFVLNENRTEEDKQAFRENALKFYQKQDVMNDIYNLDIFAKDETLLQYV